jgi:iron complex transport system ATP-binding protein
MLQVEKLSYDWRSTHGTQSGGLSLNELSFQAQVGDFVALLGPNGSGKSTLLKIIAGLASQSRPHSSGSVEYKKQNLWQLPYEARARLVSYVGSDFKSEFPLTVEEAVSLGRICHGPHPRNRDWIEYAMEKCHCLELRARDLHTLSGGQRQLVGLARAVAQQSEVLLLDEALSQMDLNYQFLMGKLLREWTDAKKLLVILVAHDFNLALHWATSVLWLKAGQKVAGGAVRDVVTPHILGTIYPQAPIHVSYDEKTGLPRVSLSPQWS